MSCYIESRSLDCNEFPSPEEQIIKAREFLTGNNKKAFKLLIKQYLILTAQIEQEEPIWTHESHMNRYIVDAPERKFVIRYVNFYDNMHINVFEWVIKESEFNI